MKDYELLAAFIACMTDTYEDEYNFSPDCKNCPLHDKENDVACKGVLKNEMIAYFMKRSVSDEESEH